MNYPVERAASLERIERLFPDVCEDPEPTRRMASHHGARGQVLRRMRQRRLGRRMILPRLQPEESTADPLDDTAYIAQIEAQAQPPDPSQFTEEDIVRVIRKLGASLRQFRSSDYIE